MCWICFPKNLEEAQTYVMLRRAYARDDAVPSAVDEAVTLKVATMYARERLCLLRCVAALATLVTVDTDVAQVARDALTRLLEKVHRQQPPLLAFPRYMYSVLTRTYTCPGPCGSVVRAAVRCAGRQLAASSGR